MDAADADGDGDQDLVFGNLSMGPESFMSQEQVKKFTAGPACIYLKRHSLIQNSTEPIPENEKNPNPPQVLHQPVLGCDVFTLCIGAI
jgi:hypothetical protein